MIIKKIVSLCKDAGVFNIIDDYLGDVQWLGNGEAYYPLEGCPIFDEDSFCTVFDISDKKREKLVLARHVGLDVLKGATPYEAPYEAEYRPMDVVGLPGVGGMMALTNGAKLLFIPSAYIEPLEMSLSELTFWERRDDSGSVYVLIRRGIVTAALVWARDILSERYVQSLRHYTQLCSGEVVAAEPEGEQMRLEEDGDE